jgi:hypothetical protein
VSKWTKVEDEHLETSQQPAGATEKMKLTRKSYLWILFGATIIAMASYASAKNLSWQDLSAMLTDDVSTSGPGWMIVIGLSLFGVRALISKPVKPKS